MNIGAEYVLPYYKNLKFGLLSSTHFNKPFTWSEARLSANVAPVRWFEASVNYAISSFGSSLGWVLNFHPNGFNFFIGTDHMITKVTPQYYLGKEEGQKSCKDYYNYNIRILKTTDHLLRD